MTGEANQPDDRHTGVPRLRTWRAVYAFVLGSFVVWLVGLALLTWWFA